MFTVSIDKWLPRFLLNDKYGYAIAKAIERALQTMNDTVRTGVDLMDNYASMPEWRLDELAWEYSIPWYDYDADLEEKRRTISGYSDTYSRLGTVRAVRDAVAAVGGDAQVDEWYQYGGQPYHYRVFSQLSGDADPSLITRARARAEYAQNVRSVLDAIYYYENGSASCYPTPIIEAIDGSIHATAR